MKKFLPFLVWLVLVMIIAWVTYGLMFYWLKSMACAAIMAAGVIFIVFIFFLARLQKNRADVHFLVSMAIYLLLTIISTLSELSFARIVFSALVAFYLLIDLAVLRFSADTAINGLTGAKIKADVLIVLMVIEAGLISAGVYYLNGLLA